MAHTDRDRDRWMRYHHENLPCPLNDREVLPFVRGRLPVHAIHCEICDRLWTGKNRIRYYISTAGYPAWAKQQRKIERGKLRNQIQMARNGRIDWDDLPSGEGKLYRRPYYD